MAEPRRAGPRGRVPGIRGAVTWAAAAVALAGISGAGRIAPSSGAAIAFEADWDDGPDRRWAGADFRPNRLQDWAVRSGRVWCLESRLDRSCRTLMAIAVRAESGSSILSARVRTGVGAVASEPVASDPVAAEAGAAEAGTDPAWRGFVVGAGGDDVDPWISGLVHARPGARGGMLAVVDRDGVPALRDFDRAVGGAGGWTLPARLAAGEAVTLPGHRVEPGPAAAEGRGVTLQLELTVKPADDGLLEARLVSRLEGGAIVATAIAPRLDPGFVDGHLGLLSHGRSGPEGTAHWFDDLAITSPGLESTGARFGPIVAGRTVVTPDQVHLTIQCVPLDGFEDPRVEIVHPHVGGGAGRILARSPLDPDAWTATIVLSRRALQRITDVGPFEAIPIEARVRGLASAAGDGAPAVDLRPWTGTIRAEPDGDRPVVIASLNCQKSWTGVRRWDEAGVWYPHREISDALLARDPDVVVFTGDQIYEGDVSGAQRRPAADARLDYLDKWYRFCVSFRDVLADRPSIVIPDDHDVYHGNIWGDGGRAAQADPATNTTAQDSGGYVMPRRFVDMVHATQVANLPAVDGAPIGMGIRPWASRVDWGGVSMAIVSDRMYKSPPRRTLPEADVRNGWPQADGFDATRDADAPGAEMLGAMQEAFLAEWATDFADDVWAKIAISSTPFVNVATLPPGAASGSGAARASMPEPGVHPRDWTLATDMDSGGWPPAARDRAVDAMRRGGAIHLCGDQHLGVLLRYGVDGPRDAGLAFCSPAIANAWPRRWYPPVEGANRAPGAPTWTGDFTDGFGHPLTVVAVANPARSGREPARLHDAMPGWGAVVLDPISGTATFECWPRWSSPAAEAPVQYPGWPWTATIGVETHGRTGWSLPPIVVESVDRPVVEVRDASGVIVAAGRLLGPVRLAVPGRGPWTLDVGEPGTDRWRRLERIVADPDEADSEPFIVRWE